MNINGENTCKDNGIVVDPFPIIPEFFCYWGAYTEAGA
jgi:hypothetical protein